MKQQTASKNRWLVRKRLHDDLLEHLCLLRGFQSSALTPDYSTHLHDPNLLPDMKIARELLARAAKERWPIAIFGDYDADGTPASALLSLAFKKLNLPHQVVLPTRQSGYGLKLDQVESIAQHAKLLITVDTGISSVEEIRKAKELGLHVIILDHHIPPASLPPADAVVDPHRTDSQYPFPHLCGCALAFKFVTALGQDFPELTDGFCKWLLDLVAVSTIADMMPLVGENRALVHYGLIVLRQNRRPGLQALLDRAGIDARSVSASTVGFSIGPRLNASGRLGDNRPAYELLVADDMATATSYADQLEEANRLRQSMVEDVLLQAREQVFKQNNPEDRIFLILGEEWPTGVVGLVAGKLSAEYSRPVIVGSSHEGEVRASCRSVEKYPIVDGLTKCSHLLKTFGGHAQAAGLSADLAGWADFCQAVKADVRGHLSEDDLCRVYKADAVLSDGDLRLEVATRLENLQPFGLGNTKPLLVLPRAEIKEVRFIGSNNRHVKVRLQADGLELDGIGFNVADRYKNAPITHGQFLGYLENNRWNGTERLQFQLIDFQDPGAMIDAIDG